MTEDPVLIETSFADAVGIIAAAQGLPEQKRRHWTTSLRQIAKAFDKPREVIPARYSAVRADLIQLHAYFGITNGTTDPDVRGPSPRTRAFASHDRLTLRSLDASLGVRRRQLAINFHL